VHPITQRKKVCLVAEASLIQNGILPYVDALSISMDPINIYDYDGHRREHKIEDWGAFINSKRQF
jgi:hypothetical protein